MPSLVGSEMCIRDSLCTHITPHRLNSLLYHNVKTRACPAFSSSYLRKSLLVSKLCLRAGGDIYDINYRIYRRTVSYTHLRAHETRHDLVCRLLLEKKKKKKK